jgi:alpha-tubulin suppressor-like RCC1 family protein
MKSVILSRAFFQLNLWRPLYTQGCGVFGALGHGDDFSDSPSFNKIVYLDDPKNNINVKQISAGWGHSSAVTSRGDLVIFGRPYDGHVIKTISRIRGMSPNLARFYGTLTSGIS